MASLTEAVHTGRRETLVAMRDKLAETIDQCPSGRDMAALTKRLMEVMDELDALPEEGAELTAYQRAKAKAHSR